MDSSFWSRLLKLTQCCELSKFGRRHSCPLYDVTVGCFSFQHVKQKFKMMIGFHLVNLNCQFNSAVQEMRVKTCWTWWLRKRWTFYVCFFHVFLFCSGVGKGDGSDLKVKIILKKQQVFQCVCAKQENCSVGLFTYMHVRPQLLQTYKRDDRACVVLGVSWRGQQRYSHQPAERACGWRRRKGHVWIQRCK